MIFLFLLQSRDGVLHGPPKPSFHTRCVFTEGGVKCGERQVPCSKYCRKHILEDKKQVLFRACSIERGGVICREPVPSIFEDSTCTLHIQLPPQRNYTQKKYESDSEDDPMSRAPSPKIKKEEPNDGEDNTKSEADADVEMSATVPDKPAAETAVEAPQDGVDTNVTICHDANETPSPSRSDSIDTKTEDDARTESATEGKDIEQPPPKEDETAAEPVAESTNEA